MKKKINTPCIGASRGRNPENRSDRTVGVPTRQFLEVNSNGTSNTLTSVSKDNLVIESLIATPKMSISENKINNIGMLNIKGSQQVRRVYDISGINHALDTMQRGNIQLKIIEEQLCSK